MTQETVELTIEQKMELAIAKAKESRKKGVILVVHKADGSIQEWIR